MVGCLTELLRPGRRWTEPARDTLFSVLVAMLIDPYMESILLSAQMTVCLDRLLQGYERSVWGSGSDSGKVSPANFLPREVTWSPVRPLLVAFVVLTLEAADANLTLFSSSFYSAAADPGRG